MWETIKKDPILKTAAIIILSVLGFGFAFNIMFGSNSGSMENGGEMTGSGSYSLGNTLSYIFTLAFQVLLIALVIAAIVAVVKLVNKHLLKGGEVKMFEQIKKDPVLKGTAIAVLLVVVFGLVYFLFSGILGIGSNYAMNGNGMITGGNAYNMMGNNSYGLGLSGILAVLLKILLFISVVGLVAGLVMYIKQNFFKDIVGRISTTTHNQESTIQCAKCGAQVPEEFKFCPSCGEKTSEECPSCGAELKAEWKCCPNCGAEKGASVE